MKNDREVFLSMQNATLSKMNTSFWTTQNSAICAARAKNTIWSSVCYQTIEQECGNLAYLLS